MRAPISPPVNLKVENCYVIINLPLSVREKKWLFLDFVGYSYSNLAINESFLDVRSRYYRIKMAYRLLGLFDKVT